ncbi:hypothetical protein BJ994_000703 [Arthrobacter pigmenti]|uniref:DoxX family membrane protein n=1 Tax=Arthrobacter pigmenti TaxID=271432 RepID=A0A846RNB1_9MICC|nr:hypothetical protein [Arthrobacter pigmenti]
MIASHIPLRFSTGAFILNSGLTKRNIDRDSAGYLQGMAANAFPQVKQLDPEKFGKVLSAVETGLGAALLLPFVPSRLVGLGLAAFSGGLLAMYFRTPEMTEDDDVRPSQQGTPVAKDVWMFGIALALIIDGGRRK